MNAEAEFILKKTINIGKLFASSPNLFDLSKLDLNDKISLLVADEKTFRNIIKIQDFSPSDKAWSIVNYINSKASRKLTSQITMTDEELAALSSQEYTSLVLFDTKYIRPALYNTLSVQAMRKFFKQNPEWVVENIGSIPKLTSDILVSLAQNNPAFIDKHVTDFSELSTEAFFWQLMIAYDKKYKQIFMNNTKSVKTKTDIRSLINLHPDIITLIDNNVLTNSELTCKEWVFIISSVINDDRLKGWRLPAETVELMKLDLAAEVLTGTSTRSVQLRNAMNKIFSPQEQPVD